MGTIWSKPVDSILSVGRCLDEAGVQNWALSRDQALRALNDLQRLGIPILGGDVYLLANGTLRLTHDSWYCNRDDGEACTDFVVRSVDTATRYIDAYTLSEAEPYFSLVPKV